MLSHRRQMSGPSGLGEQVTASFEAPRLVRGALMAGVAVVQLACVVPAAQAQQGGVAEPLGPRGAAGAPELSVPLAEEPGDVEGGALDAMDVPPKRDRLPDETLVTVERFIVTRLEPVDAAPPGCEDVIYDEFCGVRIDDWRLRADLAKLLEEYEGQFSVFDLEDVALQVTRFFRAQDRILDTAFVPPQTVAGGVVNIYVLSGRLGEVRVEGNKRLRDELLAWPFEDLVGEVVSRESITHSLLNVWDYPGLLFAPRKARLTFVPGAQTGETDIEIEVVEDPLPVNMVLSGDNAGSRFSGEYRARTDFYWNNPTGGGDQLAFGFSYAFDPENNLFYSLDYLRPIWMPGMGFGSPDWRMGFGASSSNYDIGADLEALGIDGDTEQVYVRLNRVFFQSFRERLSAEVRFSRKNAKTNQQGEQLSEDQLAPLEIGVDYLTTDELLAPEGRANQTRLIANYTHGFPNVLGSMDATDAEDASRFGADGERAGAEYDKVVAGFIRNQAAPWDTNVWVRANGQYSGDFLVPLEQFAIGGPNSVRAYPVAEYLFDTGYFASLEWEFGVPYLNKAEAMRPNCFFVPKWSACGIEPRPKLSDALSMSVFVDYAEGWLNNAREGDIDHETLAGVGVGVKYQTRNFRMGFSLATPFADGPKASNDSDPQFFFNIAYQPF